MHLIHQWVPCQTNNILYTKHESITINDISFRICKDATRQFWKGTSQSQTAQKNTTKTGNDEQVEFPRKCLF